MNNINSSPTKALDDVEDITKEFVLNNLSVVLKIIIEQIWYYRGIYPVESFRKFSAFNLEVYHNRHPGVEKYLNTLVDENLMALFKKGKLIRIFIEIYENNVKKESFGISFNNSLFLEYLKLKTPISFLEFKDVEFVAELQSWLYSIITELSKEIDEAIRNFKILISVDDDHGELIDDENWVFERSLTEGGDALKDIKLNKFKDVSLGYLNIKSYRANFI